jgi:altronate dehydratase
MVLGLPVKEFFPELRADLGRIWDERARSTRWFAGLSSSGRRGLPRRTLMSDRFSFDEIGRLPVDGDNVAISNRRLEAGTEIALEKRAFRLPHTILEGHRFALVPIVAGAPLLSWGLPFGSAIRDIAPGDYVCNARILEALRQRHVTFELPERANLLDRLVRYQFDEAAFKPGRQVPRAPGPRYFQGFARGSNRGAGTRNFIVILGTTSWTSSYARALAARFADVPARFPNIDGVVAIAHTEGGGQNRPNNLDLLLRTLAGFLVNPNVGAALAVDMGAEPVTNALLRDYLAAHDYPIGDLPHRFLSVKGNYQSALAEGETIVKSWLETANQCRRSPQSVEHLKIGLQCGGSDAFSGVSGNPLVGWVAKELVAHGGMANLAETDELIGAEEYILQNVRDLATARQFLEKLDRFQERAAWHGHSAEGNPSGGNNYRGLYNIAVKSIGAARKKDPEVCVDHVIDYSRRMLQPGFYFMDSPGNDLESVAGQVGAGCNMILFTTGNGSITNFPFVPTLKIMNSTARYRMLTKEMDVNAGRYMDGTPMAELGRETFELMLRTASGEKTAGEKAGQSQVQIWREWRQTNGGKLAQLSTAPAPSGEPLRLAENVCAVPRRAYRFKAFQTRRGYASDRVGLIVPTSLCAGQIGRMIADRLIREAASTGLRYVALAHTEGCGVSGGDSERLYLRTMAGYLAHPLVKKGLVLEHGCEKTHNDAMRNFLEQQSIDPGQFGWASIQMDGGIESVTAKVLGWFRMAHREAEPEAVCEVGLEALRLGLASNGPVPDPAAEALAALASLVVRAGGTIVVAQNSTLVLTSAFTRPLLNSAPAQPTLAYGQACRRPGFHVMETPTDHHVETLTGLGATGVDVILAHVSNRMLQGHPMVPLVQVGARGECSGTAEEADLMDLTLDAEPSEPGDKLDRMLERVLQVASRVYRPKAFASGNTDFQMTRGWLGVSL